MISESVKEISIKDIKGIRIGQAENAQAGTGCTVFISEKGMAAGLDVRGGGPASRESELLKPLAAAQTINAIVLAGGSAFGLDAAGGVMKYLEEKDIGFDVGVTKVPLVCQSDLFDLTVGDSRIRPDSAMGYAACENAFAGGKTGNGNYRDGNYGAGCGATVGKFAGMEHCMKSGIGSFAVKLGKLEIGAVVAVNALGDIYDWKNGKKIAGLLSEDKKGFRSTEELMFRSIEAVENKFIGNRVEEDAADTARGSGSADSCVEPEHIKNTTIGIVITNAFFDKTRLCKIAGMAHDGYARSIRPVHTSADGDSIYAVSVGETAADMDLTGTLAAEVMSEAVIRAVKSAESAYGFPSYRELREAGIIQ